MRGHSSSPTGGSVQGEVKGVPYCHHRLIQTAKWFCSVLCRGHGGGTEGLQGRQQSLWLVYKSFSSFLCPCTPFLCDLCSTGGVVVTGSCPPPGHYSPNTSRPAAWCPPESHPHAWQRWSCWSLSQWRSPRTSENCQGHEWHRLAPFAVWYRQSIAVEANVWFYLPVSVSFSIFIVRYGVQVGEGNDVAAVWAQPLLVKATFPVLQFSLVLVGDADVGIIVFHTHPSHSGVVTLQELVVDPLIMLHKIDRCIRIDTTCCCTEIMMIEVWAQI